MQARSTVDILGVRIDVLDKKKLNEIIITRTKSNYGKPLTVFKPYVEFLSLASRNASIRKLLNQSDINAADSVAVQWAASYLYGQPKIHPGLFHTYYSLMVRVQNKAWLSQILPDRMAGIDQTKPLLQTANKLRLKVGVIGGPKDIARTKVELTKRYKGIDWHVWSGYFLNQQEQAIVKQISACHLDILFCAMGFPRQEKFIIEYKNRLGAKVIIGEGGSFDYSELGGGIRRAPVWMRRVGLEWLWRLARQPRRLKRQLGIPAFISKVQKQNEEQK